MRGLTPRLVLSAGAAVALTTVLAGLPQRPDRGPVSVVVTESAEPLPADAMPAAPLAPAEAPRHLYRWRDARGMVHISDQPVTAPAGAERLRLPAPAAAASPLAPVPAPADGGLAAIVEHSPLGIYSVSGMESLLRDSRRIAEQLRSRDRLLESLRQEL